MWAPFLNTNNIFIMTFGDGNFFKGFPCKVVDMEGRGTLCRPMSLSDRLGKKILYANMGMPYNFAIGPQEACNAKIVDTVFRLSVVVKGGGVTLCCPQGAPAGL